jgi:hypothetical protein
MKFSHKNSSLISQTSYKSDEYIDSLEELQTVKVISSAPSIHHSYVQEANNSQDHYRSEDFLLSICKNHASTAKENFYEVSLSICNDRSKCELL